MSMSGSRYGSGHECAPGTRGQDIGLEPVCRYSDVISSGDSLQLLIL